MTALREAVYLPIAFLTVVLVGGLRVADRVALLPPPLFALVLAVLLIGVLVKCGALAPERLMGPERTPLANVNGLIVVLTTFLAAAQAFNSVTPEAGVPRVLFNVVFLVLLANTFAADPDRVRVLRSLLVIFGSAFTMKYVVLAALSGPAESMLTRALLALFEGVTLGSVTQAAFHPATGYVAFFALLLFMVGLALLPPARRPPPDSHRQLGMQKRLDGEP